MSSLRKIEFTNVPVRTWQPWPGASGAGELAYTKKYERVMGFIGRAIAAGAQVDAEVKIVERNPDAQHKRGEPYDVMTARITMPPGVPLPGARAKNNRRTSNGT